MRQPESAENELWISDRLYLLGSSSFLTSNWSKLWWKKQRFTVSHLHLLSFIPFNWKFVPNPFYKARLFADRVLHDNHMCRVEHRSTALFRFCNFFLRYSRCFAECYPEWIKKGLSQACLEVPPRQKSGRRRQGMYALSSFKNPRPQFRFLRP